MAHQKSKGATYAQRTADTNSQIAAINVDADREVRTFENRITAVNTTRDTRIVALRAAADQLTDELATEIALEFHAGAAPLIVEWIKQPSRALANALADVYRAADSRARAELGEPLWESSIAVAFAAELIKSNPSAANVFGPENTQIVVMAAALPRALDSGAGNVERALVGLEAGLQALAAAETSPAAKRIVDRFEVKKTIATHRYLSKLHAFDAQGYEAQGAATYTPREPFRERAMKAIEELVG
jgi:hypothetical protein